MKVYPDVDFNILKHEFAEKQQLTENQKTTEYRNKCKMGANVFHLLVKGEVRTLDTSPVKPLL